MPSHLESQKETQTELDHKFFYTEKELERKNLLEVFLSGSSFCSLGEPILAAETQHAGLIQSFFFFFPDVLGQALRFHLFFVSYFFFFSCSSSSRAGLSNTFFVCPLFNPAREGEKAEWYIIKRERERMCRTIYPLDLSALVLFFLIFWFGKFLFSTTISPFFLLLLSSLKKKADRYGFWHALPPAILGCKKSLAKGLQVVFIPPKVLLLLLFLYGIGNQGRVAACVSELFAS